MKENAKELRHVLIGNSFPMGLICRPVRIDPMPIEAARLAIRGAVVHSFWGHIETMTLAEQLLGCSLQTSSYRPALRLDEQGLPTLNGRSFTECWILTPAYVPGYRPPLPGESSRAGLGKGEPWTGWRALRIRWLDEKTEMES